MCLERRERSNIENSHRLKRVYSYFSKSAIIPSNLTQPVFLSMILKITSKIIKFCKKNWSLVNQNSFKPTAIPWMQPFYKLNSVFLKIYINFGLWRTKSRTIVRYLYILFSPKERPPLELQISLNRLSKIRPKYRTKITRTVLLKML